VKLRIGCSSLEPVAVELELDPEVAELISGLGSGEFERFWAEDEEEEPEGEGAAA